MTFDDLGRKLKSLPDGHNYQDIPERLLALAFLKANPQYWDLISPEARKLQEVLEFDPHIPTFSITDKVEQARKQSDLIAHKRLSATNLHLIDAIQQANELSIPFEILSQWKLEEQRLNHQIALKEAEVRLKFEEAKRVLELKKLENEMFPKPE